MARKLYTSAEVLRELGQLKILLSVALLAILAPAAALADPCKAIPDKGPLPSYLERPHVERNHLYQPALIKTHGPICAAQWS